MNEDRKKRGLANGKFFTAVAICALFLGSGNVMAAQTASNDSQGVQEQMQSISYGCIYRKHECCFSSCNSKFKCY